MELCWRTVLSSIFNFGQTSKFKNGHYSQKKNWIRISCGYTHLHGRSFITREVSRNSVERFQMTDWRIKNIISTATRCVGYNKVQNTGLYCVEIWCDCHNNNEYAESIDKWIINQKYWQYWKALSFYLSTCICMHVYCVPRGVKRQTIVKEIFMFALWSLKSGNLDNETKFTKWMSQNLKFNILLTNKCFVKKKI